MSKLLVFVIVGSTIATSMGCSVGNFTWASTAPAATVQVDGSLDEIAALVARSFRAQGASIEIEHDNRLLLVELDGYSGSVLVSPRITPGQCEIVLLSPSPSHLDQLAATLQDALREEGYRAAGHNTPAVMSRMRGLIGFPLRVRGDGPRVWAAVRGLMLSMAPPLGSVDVSQDEIAAIHYTGWVYVSKKGVNEGWIEFRVSADNGRDGVDLVKGLAAGLRPLGFEVEEPRYPDVKWAKEHPDSVVGR